jgi:hypothetical protein
LFPREDGAEDFQLFFLLGGIIGKEGPYPEIFSLGRGEIGSTKEDKKEKTEKDCTRQRAFPVD